MGSMETQTPTFACQAAQPTLLPFFISTAQTLLVSAHVLKPLTKTTQLSHVFKFVPSILMHEKIQTNVCQTVLMELLVITIPKVV